ncbi:hypothetical protein A3Q56_04995 [Intoshia linei]|uniref:Tyrosine-protein phosphatase domain-containing protein n=1 Tax=Intoshia linei TaxID=1819745 RepID=A0A177AZ49_9BILA|nr:hypothetical protein A3Q56_04995 [Intoshia linei]
MKLTGIVTDGAAAMIGQHNGVATSYIVTCAGKCKLKCWIPKKISSVSVSSIKCKNKKCQTMNMSCLKMEGKSGVFQRGYGKVLPRLYIGNIFDAFNYSILQDYGITHIVSIHEKAEPRFQSINYYIIKVKDSDRANIKKFIPDCLQFIHLCRRGNSANTTHSSNFNEKLIEFVEIPNKTAYTISEKLLALLQNNNLSPNNIITDTEPTNVGCRNGVVVRLQRVYPDCTFSPCKLHVLDLILKHQWIHLFLNVTVGPIFLYEFVKSLHDDWKRFIAIYRNAVNSISPIYDDLPNDEKRRKDYFVAGLSRSTAIVVAYLMVLYQCPFNRCFQFVKSCRPTVKPNSGFIKQLKSLDIAKLKSNVECNPEEFQIFNNKDLKKY